MIYYHRPHIGDVIYGLPVIREVGRGTLLLDAASEPGYEENFRQALSFFRRQAYIVDCRLYGGEQWDYDLDAFRHVTKPLVHPTVNLVDSHFLAVGWEPPSSLQPWLVADQRERRLPVVIHRSARYHGDVDYMFLHQIKRGDLYCVGFEDEVRTFRDVLGAIWIPTTTLDELAAVINSSGVFIGNQSSPLALAAGLGKARLIEECPWWPNCTLGHANECVLGMDPDRNFASLCRLGYTPHLQNPF